MRVVLTTILVLASGWLVPLSSAATLSGTVLEIPRNSVVDLTAAGALDWVHWGLHTDTSLDRKANVPAQISDFSLQHVG